MLFLTLIVLSINLLQGFNDRKQSEEIYQDLRVNVIDNPNTEVKTLLVNNPDYFGYLTVDNTNISYPVMFRPGDSNYYLTHNYLGEESISGCPFLAGESNIDSKNYIIYGHHMADGSQFSDLESFCDKSFFTNSPIATLTLKSGEKRLYNPIAVFKTSIDPNEFPYYSYTDCRDDKELEEYLDNILRLSLYSSVTVNNGKLLTLSTCSYHSNNGRLVVVFQQI